MGSGMRLGMTILRLNRGVMIEFWKFGCPREDDMGFLELVCRDLSA